MNKFKDLVKSKEILVHMETIEEIIEQEITEPLVEETHHTHHIPNRTHRHHHNGSIVMVNTQTGQVIHRGGHEMNNNGNELNY